MLLQNTFDLWYIALAYILSYYGLVTFVNVMTIYTALKVSNKNNININFKNNNKASVGTEQYSEASLLILAAICCGILTFWVPLSLVYQSKHYYIDINTIDDNTCKSTLSNNTCSSIITTSSTTTTIEVTYQWFYLILSSLLLVLLPYTTMYYAPTTEKFKTILSNSLIEDTLFNDFISKHGYINLLKRLTSSCSNDLFISSMVSLYWTIIQYLSIYSINLNITITINWIYMILSVMLKFLGLSLGGIFLYKYKLMFIFFKGDDLYLFIVAAISVFIGTSGTIIGEMAIIVSVNLSFSIDSFSFSFSMLLFYC
jgi:hypothetical protein